MFSEESDRSSRSVTVGVFAVLLGLVTMATNVIPMPSRDSVDRSLEMIILESIEMASAEEVEESVEEDFTEIVDEEIAALPEVEMDDFDELLSDFFTPDLSEDALGETNLSGLGGADPTALESDLNLDFSGSDGISDLFGDDRPSDMNADLLSQTEADVEGWTLNPNLVSVESSASESERFQIDDDLQSGDELLVEEDRADNPLQSMLDETDLSSTLTAEEMTREAAVTRSIKASQSSLDKSVLSLLGGAGAGDITTNQTITIQGTSYTVQILYSPSSRKLHVVLIAGDDLYYFIDPGLQNKPNYFEKGVVRRNGAEIALVETEELSTQSREAKEVFAIFLSWWEKQQ